MKLFPDNVWQFDVLHISLGNLENEETLRPYLLNVFFKGAMLLLESKLYNCPFDIVVLVCSFPGNIDLDSLY